MASTRRPHFGLVEFSTEAVCAADRFEYWCEMFGSVHSVEVERDRRASFSASYRTWRLGPVLVGHFETPARWIVRDKRQVRQDDLDHIVLRVTAHIPKRGRADDGRASEAGQVAQPLQLGIGSYATAYEQHLPEGPWVSAILDRNAFPELWGWHADPQLLHGTSAALLARFLASLPDALRSMQAEEEPELTHAVRTMISACLAGCLNLSPSGPEAEQVSLRLRVEQIMAENLASPRLTPARIAELVGVSRSTLYRSFETCGGIAELC